MSAGQAQPPGPRVFTVAWDRSQNKFVVRDDRNALLGAAAERANAIGIAIRSANTDRKSGGQRDHGRRHRQEDDDATVGFGDDVPAFMRIVAKV